MIQEIINKVEAIKIESTSNGSEVWIGVGIEGVRKNSKLGKEMIEAGFDCDSYYGMIYSVSGNLPEKEEKAKLLQSLLYKEGIKAVTYERAL